MTTIVAIQTDTGVKIGADTQATLGSDRIMHISKIMHNGPFIIGGAGDAYMLDLLHYIWKPPVLTAIDKKDIHRYIVAKVGPSLRELFENDKLYSSRKNTDDKLVFDFLFVIGGEVFNIGDDYSVLKSRNNFHAVGSGSMYALGALCVGATLEKALEAAAENDSKTSAPFEFYEQKK